MSTDRPKARALTASTMAAALLCRAAGAWAAEAADPSAEAAASVPIVATVATVATIPVDRYMWHVATPENKPPPLRFRADGGIDSSEFARYAEEHLDGSLYDESGIVTRLGQLLTERTASLCEEAGPECRRNAEDSIQGMVSGLVESQSGRYLLPLEYRPVGRPLSAERLDALTGSLSDEAGCDELTQATDDFLFGPDDVHRRILDKARTLPHCRKDMLERAWETLSDMPLPDHCYGLADARDLRVCRTMAHDHRRIRERTSALIDAIRSEEAASTGHACSPQKPVMEHQFRLIDSFLRSVSEQLKCAAYPIGDQRTHRPNPFSGYRITRTATGAYAASLALEFVPAEDYDNADVPTDQVHDHYLRRVRGCMEDANRDLLGPGDARLSIDVQDASRDRPDALPTHRISIRSSEYRSSAIGYAADVNCRTILHEVLHLLGLPDEYEERHLGEHLHPERGDRDASGPAFRPSFNCRVVQDNSIMAHHGDRFLTVEDGRSDSLLDPAHFNTILYPECESREDTRLYRECSSLAYKTSHGGSGNRCGDKKDRCERSNVLGRDKRSELDRLHTIKSSAEYTVDRWRRIFYQKIYDFLREHEDASMGPDGDRVAPLLERLLENAGSGTPIGRELTEAKSIMETSPPGFLNDFLANLLQSHDGYSRHKSLLDDVQRQIENVEAWD